MQPENQEPFDRESWRRLLGADSGAPTKEIDRRVLAEARRALVPRIGRWWLPASLAASLLLAVLIVQSQLVVVKTPVPVTEADVPIAAPAERTRDNAADMTAEMPAERREDSADAVPDVPPPLIELPAQDSQSAPAAALPLPQSAAEPAMSAKEEGALLRNQTAVADSAPDVASAAEQAPAPAQSEAESAASLGMLKSRQSYAESRTPEQWYADIEALRAAGRIKEADAELARFKSKNPGWLDSHQRKDP